MSTRPRHPLQCVDRLSPIRISFERQHELLDQRAVHVLAQPGQRASKPRPASTLTASNRARPEVRRQHLARAASRVRRVTNDVRAEKPERGHQREPISRVLEALPVERPHQPEHGDTDSRENDLRCKETTGEMVRASPADDELQARYRGPRVARGSRRAREESQPACVAVVEPLRGARSLPSPPRRQRRTTAPGAAKPDGSRAGSVTSWPTIDERTEQKQTNARSRSI